MELSVIKTIAAFMNSDGGTLLIGVDDDGEVVGLENDMKTLKKRNADAFEQTLVNLVVRDMGAEFAGYMQTRFEEVDGKVLCVVEVDQAGSPAYTNTAKGAVFFVRAGNTTRPLDPEETVAYVGTHWQ